MPDAERGVPGRGLGVDESGDQHSQSVLLVLLFSSSPTNTPSDGLTPHTSSAMDHRSSFERLVPDVLGCIAFHAFDPRRPHDLLSLFLTSRTVKAALDPLKTSILADCFRVAFDTEAPARRLGDFHLTDDALADQLRLRYLTLRRVRAARPSTPLPVRQRFSALYRSSPALLKRDLWVLYLAVLEDDYKNAELLVNWAGLQHWLWLLVSLRYGAQGRPWYALTQEDVEITSLILWLIWMTTTPDDIQRETPIQRQTVRNLLHAFVLRGFQYPSSYFPSSFKSLPLCHFPDLPPEALQLPFDLVPPTTTINHFSLPIRISYPPLVPPAMMLASARAFVGLKQMPYNQYAQAINPNDPVSVFRAAAHHHWIHNTNKISFPCTSASASTSDAREEENEDEEEDRPTRSERNDEDWHRLVSCTDPFALEDEPILRGRVISPGSLSGSWHGVISHPDIARFFPILLSPSIPIHGHVNPPTGDLDCTLTQHPFYCELREYHSFEGSVPLRTGESWHEGEGEREDGEMEMEMHGEGMMNAWFPEGVKMRSVENALIFEDPTTSSTHRYEEYIPSIGGYNSSTVRSALPRKGFPERDYNTNGDDANTNTNTNTNTNDDGEDGEDGKGEGGGHACVFRWRKESPFAGGVWAGAGGGDGEHDGEESEVDPQPLTGQPDFHSHGPKAGSGTSNPREDDEEGEEEEDEGMETYSDADAEGEAQGEVVMEDHVDYATSGVQDIILAGESSYIARTLFIHPSTPSAPLACSHLVVFLVALQTGPLGDAFGHFGFIARVRSWDGMVLMLRYPSDPTHHPGPRWLFQGYIHAGGNFVGRWRDTQGGEAVQGLEGGFLLVKREGEGEGGV
ncbi:uncharacterized protein STEHIDRAFT_152613 [Stereum hirsutum FP-91666 SS1]|uniref:uncharacterized protein n=1 Tax=Stereum hirsutum (strain FP-91666) TaxID=721885 RepID=UPI000440C596|nr:uncharacterized protein STEHIDRAFT_152613 [Stereum hirsutum FP-91666 SS1]EIM90929.1 hypothetical protein STEHIDRAFT_152613 [Stereum hirsutum FP-91666 SS1]